MTTIHDEPQLMIVGTGRHGSGYIARLLTASGVPCGHEQWWNPYAAKIPGLAADSSWIGGAHLRHYHGNVALLTRNPLDVVTSLVAAPMWGPYLATAEALVGAHRGDELEFALRFTTCTLVAAALHVGEGMTLQVETIGTAQLMVLADLAGQRIPGQVAEEAIASIPRDFNQHHDGDRIDLHLLEQPAYRERWTDLRAVAATCGYTL